MRRLRVAKVESIGFNLINACLMQKSANMKNLNSNFKKYIGLNTENVEFLSEDDGFVYFRVKEGVYTFVSE